MKMYKAKFLIVILSTLVLTGLLSACGSSEAKVEKEAPAAKTAAVFSLKKDKISTTLQLPGELIAYRQVELYAKVNSYVKELKVDIGSEVKEGQLLVLLEAPELSSQLAAAESNLKSQEAIYIASKANYDRLLESSQTPGAISQNDIDQAAARKNSDFAKLEAVKASYKEISVMKGYLEIRAPFTGIVTARNINLGAYVGPAGKGSEFPLFTVQEQKQLRLVVYIPEAFTSYLQKENEVSFKVNALPNEKFKAKVKRLSGALDLRLRAERVEMDVTNNDKVLLPGMVAEVNIPLNGTDSSFVVPKTAVVNSAEGIYVIKVVNNKAERVNVKQGRELEGRIEIFGTLNEGDILLTAANEEIKNGMEIKK